MFLFLQKIYGIYGMKANFLRFINTLERSVVVP